jgi:hypothetical protein
LTDDSIDVSWTESEVVEKPKISVAIVTARENKDTSYDRWRDLRSAFLNRASSWKDPATNAVLPLWQRGGKTCPSQLSGEFGALLTACLAVPYRWHHVEYQLQALAMQTRIPDDIYIVSRVRWPNPNEDGPGGLGWWPPLLSQRELELQPESALGPSFEFRKNTVSFGCADKNTAVALCRTEYLIVLDDCCLPGFGLVEAAYQACKANKILLLGHRKISFPREGDEPQLSHSDSNLTIDDPRKVFGIWAMPIKHILAINGWNTQLDGFRGGDDEELKRRTDIYVAMRGLDYAVSPAARVYEIDHENPWGDGPLECSWSTPNGYAAPGPRLKDLHAAANEYLNVLEEEDGPEPEAEEIDEEDGPDDG